MEAQIAQFTNRGMNQDISVSKATNEFAFKNYNIRITAVNDNTLLTVTNEKQPRTLTVNIYDYRLDTYLNSILGEYIGHAILNNFLILFTKAEAFDRIYKLEYDTENSIINGRLLFMGNLGFYKDNVEHIETLSFYETEDIQKVYWVDGVHQTRFINIMSNEIPSGNTQFDFNPNIKKFPKCTISKDYSNGGTFAPGVIQYFVSYYNKYGTETGIVWASDLQYITKYNKGESPDKNVNCSFILNFENLDNTFEYIRVYSLYRTSYNGEVVAQIVADRKVSEDLLITDINSNEVIDPTSLFFIGGNKFVAETLTQKDDTLFLGGITSKEEIIPENIKTLLSKDNVITIDSDGKHISKLVTFESKVIGKVSQDINEEFQLNSSEENIKTFKYGELYRFALQFQTPAASWTNPIWIGDAICNVKPVINEDGTIEVANAVIHLDDTIVSEIKNVYSNYRLLIANPTNADRTILAQGIVSPTVFKYDDRVQGEGAYALSSWLMRPRNTTIASDHLIGLGNKKTIKNDVEYFENLESCEIQNSINKAPIISKGSYTKGFILSFYSYRGETLYYSVHLGNNPKNDITQITDSDIEETIISERSVSINLKGDYYSVANTFTEILQTIKDTIENLDKDGIKYDINFSSSMANTLANYFMNIFGIYPPVSSSLDYTGVYKKMPDGTYCSGFFDMTDSFILKRTNGEMEYGCYGYILSNYTSTTETDDYINNFYVDNSILTFHSPEINNNEALFTDNELTFDIVGLIGIDKFQSDASLIVDLPYLNSDAHLVKPSKLRNKPLTNEPLFKDGFTYYMYLWHKSNSVVGQVANWDEPDKNYSFLKTKVISNRNVSLSTHYIDYLNTSYDTWSSLNVKPVVFDSDQVITKVINVGEDTKYYQGNYEGISAISAEEPYRVFYKESRNAKPSYKSDDQSDPVSIKYKSTPHLVFSLGNNVLPYLKNNGESNWKVNFKSFYNLDDLNEYETSLPWLTANEGLFIHAYNQSYIETDAINKPYFYLTELRRNVDYNTLYGGVDQNALERISWIPASKTYNVEEPINLSFGDTYYQRWDCLKTYPFTREDKNSVIDITSFMVETHVNLLGRYDKHKEMDDILNVEPSNFNLINDVYSQPNNFFSYIILDEKYNTVKHLNQVTYSLNKAIASDIDAWTSITLSSAFNLDGSKGKLNKLLNFNDTIVAFQDKAISAINFNNRTALSTESGIPIEIANSGKVNGYSIIIDNVGCQNKQSICEASSGVYFVDDLNKTFYNFNKEGLTNVSSKGLSVWFKDNLTKKERVVYDNLTHDVYITNENECVVYNEDLQSFTSFMDYKNIDTLVTLNSRSILFDNTLPKLMFGGDYTSNYFMEYKVNPEPLMDKIFGNIEYIAECIPSDIKIDTIGNTLTKPFDRLDVWNEYQEGSTTIKEPYKYPNFEKKFRIWRVDIPRDSKNGRGLNRIRNPWVYLKLSNKNQHSDKMVFHNLLVKYYK